MRGARDDLGLELHYGRDLVQSDVLVLLQAVLASSAPTMHAGLEVHAHERDPDRLVVDAGQATGLRDAVLARGTCRGATYEALVAESAPPPEARRFGDVVLRGRGPGTGGRYVRVRFDTLVPAMPIGSTWLWSTSIVLRSAPATVVDEDENRLVLRAFESPEDWPDAVAAKERLRAHLGDDVFFDRERPDRPTRAPDFGLAPLGGGRPFEVVTADGHHLTPLPRLDG